MTTLPEDYVIQKFYQFCGAPKHNRYNKTYQGSCPICREGRSWLRKKRCYYIPVNNNVFCHNCGWSGSPLRWIREVSGLSFNEIQQEVESRDSIQVEEAVQRQAIKVETLPTDSINLSDSIQCEYYKDEVVVQRVLEFLRARKLDTCVNKPNFYISLTDRVHKNRLIIPFVDEEKKIVHYQTRTILKADEKIKPRYISKIGSEKTLFNYGNVDLSYEHLFVFEGPLNACFCKNGVAVAGIQDESKMLFTDRQQQQINKLPMHNIVWCLDSQWVDTAALKKSILLADQGENLFIWPEKLGKRFKDINDLVIAANIPYISPEFILQNTYSGIKASVMLRAISQQ